MTSSNLVATNCKVVKGRTKSLLLDLQRQKFYRIDNSWVVEESGSTSLNINRVFKESPEVFNFLREQEIILKDPVNSIPISDKWQNYNRVSNAVFEVKGFNYFSAKLIDEIEQLGIEYIALVIEDISVAIKRILPLFHQRNIANVDIVTSFNSSFEKDLLSKLVVKSRRISSILVYNSIENDLIDLKRNQYILYSTKKFAFRIRCGFISLEKFSPNLSMYFESHHHNSCLNRKISIDSEGNIKNCPSMKESFGNIKDTTLAEALEKPSFKKYWDINKDKIHVCKDCEFRYICTDCRAYVEDPDDILSKPLKCDYNPYTGEWSEWSTNPLKQKAINFYGMREMVEGGGNESK